jgi:hypothetical protein
MRRIAHPSGSPRRWRNPSDSIRWGTPSSCSCRGGFRTDRSTSSRTRWAGIRCSDHHCNPPRTPRSPRLGPIEPSLPHRPARPRNVPTAGWRRDQPEATFSESDSRLAVSQGPPSARLHRV